MTVALATNALTELATIKSELGIAVATHDDYLTRTINVVSDAIEAYCNRVFFWEEDIEEDYTGHGTVVMVLNRSPIDTIGSIEYNDTEIDTDRYEIHNAAAGLVYGLYGWIWTTGTSGTITGDPISGAERKRYTVTYDAGYVTPKQETEDESEPPLVRDLPWDIEDACIQLCVARYNARGRDPNIKSEKLLSWSASYGNSDGTDSGFPASVEATLNKHMRIPGA